MGWTMINPIYRFGSVVHGRLEGEWGMDDGVSMVFMLRRTWICRIELKMGCF